MVRWYTYAGPCPICKLPMEGMTRRERKPGDIVGEVMKRYRHEDDKTPAHYDGCQRQRLRG